MFIKNETIKSIRREASHSFESLRQIRRDLHAHPERSGDELWTSNYLANALSQLGLQIYQEAGGHGLVADLVTNPANPIIALRVDMDALPINEVNDVPYHSKMPGFMHACGHDVHSAIGVGTASVLANLSHEIPCNFRIVFQPEEETITGALRMIREGVLTNPIPKAIFGLHVAPLPVGQIAWSDGLFLAGFDHYLVTLMPREEGSISYAQLDAVAKRCCQAVLRLNQWHLPETWEEMQTFWGYLIEPPESLRNFIVYDASLDNENPAAWYGQFGLGVKAANPHLRRSALGKIRGTLNRICRMTKTNYQIEHMGSMIDLINDPQLVQSTLPSLERAIGEKNLIPLKAAFPFNCEDFAYYTKEIPGAMFWLGAANPKEGKYALLHTPDFDVDEACLLTGTIAMSSLLVEAAYLNV